MVGVRPQAQHQGPHSILQFHHRWPSGKCTNDGSGQEQQARVMAERGEEEVGNLGAECAKSGEISFTAFWGLLPLLLDQTIASSSRDAH